MSELTLRPERPGDEPAIRSLLLAAFPTPLEADLTDSLRRGAAWLPGLSWVGELDGTICAQALLTRAHIGEVPALGMGPVAVAPEHQRRGFGGLVINAALRAAQDAGERFVFLLGHPAYYPRFGFARASSFGIVMPFEAPDEAGMALALGPDPLPAGVIRYAPEFGV
jgi:putative acetyltransferase